jgi:DNA-binding transcriptional regulator YiaG
LLRGLDHSELIETGIDMSLTQDHGTTRPRLDSHELSGIFGIEMDTTISSSSPSPKKIKIPQKTQKKRSKASISKTAGKSYPKTGTAVAKLRRKFAMTETEFASLLEVSRHTIRNWEKQPGTLTLRQQNNDALKAAAQLSKQQSWRKLGNK